MTDDPDVPDGKMVWQAEPDWLRISRLQRLSSSLRVMLHRSLGIPTPSHVAYKGPPIGPRRILRRIRRLP